MSLARESERFAVGSSDAGRATARTVAILVVAGMVLRAILAALVPLGADEAYYADWARHLQPGYLDHPPLVAWLLAPWLRLLGPTPLAARLPAILLQAGTTLLAASLAQARGGPRAALLAAVLLQVAPMFSLFAVLVTPDAPLALAWVGAIWAFERALRLDRRWMLAAGAFLGLAALSKLTAGLLGAALLLALLLSRDGRELLATPWPWLGAAVALALASPMLLWNAAHGWPSFAFQAQHGLHGRSFSALRLGQSAGAQAVYLSPVLLVLAAAAAFGALRRGGGAVDLGLALSALPVVAFFTVAAALTPGALPHWPAPGWLSALLLLAPAASGWIGSARRCLRLAVGTGLAMVAAIVAGLLALLLIPLPVALGVTDDPGGWCQGARASQEAAGGRRLATTHWVAYGQLAWCTGGEVAYLGERLSGPSFYQRPAAPDEPLLVVTVDGLGPGRDALEARLGRLEPAGGFTASRGGCRIRSYSFWSNHPPKR